MSKIGSRFGLTPTLRTYVNSPSEMDMSDVENLARESNRPDARVSMISCHLNGDDVITDVLVVWAIEEDTDTDYRTKLSKEEIEECEELLIKQVEAHFA